MVAHNDMVQKCFCEIKMVFLYAKVAAPSDG
jgi:hypothetical protein